MTAQSRLATALERKAPPMGGFSPGIVRLEVRRLLRNRRTMIFTLLMPVIFFFAFGLNSGYDTLRVGHGNESAFVMISFGLYGAVFATASGGAMVSVERVWGWSRQLRVTPLSSTAYIVTKMLTALVLGASSVLAVYVVGGITNKPSMPLQFWVITALCVWIGSLLFAAFGLFIGYLLLSENVMQVIGFAALRISAGCDGSEQVPVGLSRVEQ
jgi:ABC-2 type transport system permease protein